MTVAALTIGSTIDKVHAITTPALPKRVRANDAGAAAITEQRTLGRGRYAMQVSALGFGVMGMTYNRSEHPSEEQCIRSLPYRANTT